MGKIRILHVLNGLEHGGAETLIRNMFENIDHTKYQFDFLLRSCENDSAQISYYEKHGSKIYITAPFPKSFLKNYQQVKRILQKNSYDVIHVHANSLLYVTPLILTRKANRYSRIIHSHNTQSTSQIFHILHLLNRRFIERLATNYFACGEEAGKWMFKERKFTVFNNAVNTDKFDYNPQVRTTYKSKLNLEDKIVIGHIGRFVKQKNHEFLLTIFQELVKRNDKYHLLLIGEGELEESIKEKAEKLGLSDAVSFLGTRSDISELFQVFDMFLFPSLYEGLPFVLVEAQASGTPVVASDTISYKSKITDLVTFVPLSESADKWADIVEKKMQNKKSYRDSIVRAHYDSKENAIALCSMYERMVNQIHE